VAGTFLLLDEVDCDNGCDAEAVLVEILAFVGPLLTLGVDDGVAVRAERPMTISTLSFG
jgi:hypothetical protein